MKERTKFHVGLDVHKDSISVAAAELGRAPARLIGKVTHDLNKLLKVLAGTYSSVGGGNVNFATASYAAVAGGLPRPLAVRYQRRPAPSQDRLRLPQGRAPCRFRV